MSHCFSFPFTAPDGSSLPPGTSPPPGKVFASSAAPLSSSVTVVTCGLSPTLTRSPAGAAAGAAGVSVFALQPCFLFSAAQEPHELR